MLKVVLVKAYNQVAVDINKIKKRITKLSDWIIDNKHEFNFIKCLDNLFNKYVIDKQ